MIGPSFHEEINGFTACFLSSTSCWIKGVWVPVLPPAAAWRFLLHSPLHTTTVHHCELAKDMATGSWGRNECRTQKKQVIQVFKKVCDTV